LFIVKFKKLGFSALLGALLKDSKPVWNRWQLHGWMRLHFKTIGTTAELHDR